MNVSNVILANYVEQRGGLAYVTGGFPEWWEVPDFGVQSEIGMLVVLEMQSDDIGKDFEFAVRLVHPTGEVDTLFMFKTIRFERKDQAPDSPLYQLIPLPLKTVFRMEGVHLFRLYDVQNTELACVKMAVVKRQRGLSTNA